MNVIDLYCGGGGASTGMMERLYYGTDGLAKFFPALHHCHHWALQATIDRNIEALEATGVNTEELK